MTDLEADIARIAALRGKPPENYAAREHERVARSQRIDFNDVLGLMTQPENGRQADFKAYESLSAAGREHLRSFPFSASAVKFKHLAERVGDEQLVIRVMNQVLPHLRSIWVSTHFGQDHPAARKLTESPNPRT